jgi:hypothetical protein
MSGYQIVTGGHLGDAVLMQLIDQEPATPAEAREHLGLCESCAARLKQLREAGGMLRAALLDVAMPRLDFAGAKIRRRIWLMPIPIAAAATLVVLASAAAATLPVRAWIMRHLSPEPTTSTPVTPPVTTSALVGVKAGIIASFAPTDTSLVIRFDRRQSSGALDLSVTGTDRISAQAIDGAAAEELVVLPGELRVVNAATSVANYRVTIPLSVRAVRVVVGTTEVAVLRVTSGLERRIDLR